MQPTSVIHRVKRSKNTLSTTHHVNDPPPKIATRFLRRGLEPVRCSSLAHTEVQWIRKNPPSRTALLNIDCSMLGRLTAPAGQRRYTH